MPLAIAHYRHNLNDPRTPKGGGGGAGRFGVVEGQLVRPCDMLQLLSPRKNEHLPPVNSQGNLTLLDRYRHLLELFYHGLLPRELRTKEGGGAGEGYMTGTQVKDRRSCPIVRAT